MKVMFVIPHISDGGAERILSELSQNLSYSDLILVVFEEKAGYPFKGRLVSLNLPLQRGSLLRRASGLLQRIRSFKNVLKQERPDVVVSFMGEANILNSLTADRPILTVHNHLTSLTELTRTGTQSAFAKMRISAEAFARTFLFRRLYRRATVVAVAEAVKTELVDHFHVPSHAVSVIPNAINADDIRSNASESVVYPWKPGVPVIITAGRLTLQKGQWHLIRAFAEVHRKVNCQLAILGTGELEARLRSLAKDLGVESDVYFLGWQANPFKFISKADLFVLPSLSEGSSLALLEAMACELPVIATDCPGASRDILVPVIPSSATTAGPEYAKYGILVPALNSPDQEVHLAEAIERMLQDPALRKRYAKASVERVRDFGYAAFVEKYERLIEKTAKTPRS